MGNFLKTIIENMNKVIKFVSVLELPFLAIMTSILSLCVSLTTFVILNLPINNLGYRVNAFYPQIYIYPDNSTDIAFSSSITVYNNGNEPAGVTAIETYMYKRPHALSINKITDSECNRSREVPTVQFYLYEHEEKAPQNPRGSATEAAFGRKLVPARSLTAYNVLIDEHRFSAFPQINDDSQDISGLVCVDVTITLLNGRIAHNPKAVGLIETKRKSFNFDKDWRRVNPPTLPIHYDDINYGPGRDKLTTEPDYKVLYRGWLYFL